MNIGKQITAGLFSPGWPMSRHPSGIVTYVHNISTALGQYNVRPIILSDKVDIQARTEINVSIIDLSDRSIQPSLIRRVRRFANPILDRVRSPLLDSAKIRMSNLDMARAIKAALKKNNTPLDIIEVEESFGMATALRKTLGVPVITRLHGPWFTQGPIMGHFNKPRVRAEGRAISLSHGITSPSLDVLNKVREYYDIELPDAAVIPNPAPSIRRENQWNGATSPKPILLLVGRFDLVKGGDIAIKAFQHIASANSDVEFHFVGPDRKLSVNGKQYSFQEYIHEFIPESDIRRRIHFYGHCDENRIAELRQKSCVTMVTSRYEVFGMTLLEALSTGCPTVATSVGGMKEIVRDNVNGLLARPEDHKDIAEKVLSLLDNSQLRLELSRNAIDDTIKRFSSDVIAKKTYDFYCKTIDKFG